MIFVSDVKMSENLITIILTDLISSKAISKLFVNIKRCKLHQRYTSFIGIYDFNTSYG